MDKKRKAVVVTGTREMEVYGYLLSQDATMYSFEIVCDAPIRYERLLKLGKVKTPREFLDQELREKEMGTEELMRIAPFVVPTRPDTDPDLLADKMAEVLLERGVNWI